MNLLKLKVKLTQKCQGTNVFVVMSRPVGVILSEIEKCPKTAKSLNAEKSQTQSRNQALKFFMAGANISALSRSLM